MTMGKCMDCQGWTPTHKLSEHGLCPTCDEVFQEGLAHYRKVFGLKGVGDAVEGSGVPPAIEKMAIDMRERHK